MKYILLLLLINFSIFAGKNYVLFGPPGSGKGTFSSYLIDYHGYIHICPGDIVRRHIKDGTELGKLIKPIVERGDYVDDQIINKIIEEKVRYCVKNNCSFIIDAFPRNEIGVDFLVNLLKTTKIFDSVHFVHFLIGDQRCMDRIKNRLVCFQCRAIYNLVTKKTKDDLVCDTCGAKLEIRLGDNIAVTQKRLDYYRLSIEPLLDKIKTIFPVIEFDATIALSDCISAYETFVNT